MKHIEIEATLRESVGKKSTKAIRKQGNVPCVVYGKDENIHFYSPENAFRKLIFTPNAYTIKLKFKDKTIDVILQDIQYHPVKDNILHIDFFQIFDDIPVKIGIPVKMHGFPVGVQEGGKLLLEQRRLLVKGLLKDLPDVLDVDIEGIALGKVLKVEELDYENLELIDNPKTVVASVKLTRAAKGLDEEEEVEGEEGEEGEEGAQVDADGKPIATEGSPEGAEGKPEGKKE